MTMHEDFENSLCEVAKGYNRNNSVTGNTPQPQPLDVYYTNNHSGQQAQDDNSGVSMPAVGKQQGGVEIARNQINYILNDLIKNLPNLPSVEVLKLLNVVRGQKNADLRRFIAGNNYK